MTELLPLDPTSSAPIAFGDLPMASSSAARSIGVVVPSGVTALATDPNGCSITAARTPSRGRGRVAGPVPAAASGETADLLAVLRLAPMPPATRVATIGAVRLLREALTGGPDLAVADFATAVAGADRALRDRLGPRHSQILSDCRRALRLWGDENLRDLVRRTKGRLPMLSDAIAAALRIFAEDRAVRAEAAIRRFARSQGTAPEEIAATTTVLSPLLRALTPESMEVGSKKSLDNQTGLIRAAVRLVDPDALQGREADVAGLPAAWRAVLGSLKSLTPDRAEAARAIHRRLAAFAARDHVDPADLTKEFIENFLARERATKARGHAEKLRSAAKIWNDAVDSGAIITPRLVVATPRHRLPDVDWSSVPDGIRGPVDALMNRIESPVAGFDWSALVEEGDDELALDIDLGLGALVAPEPADDTSGVILREEGTAKNWQDATKRCWHAAENDPRVKVKSRSIEDLYAGPPVLAMIRAVRSARRTRLEAQGSTWEGHEKGRYECGLVECLLGLGRALDIVPERLEILAKMVPEIDPVVVSRKMNTDGTIGYVYDDRRIGPAHATMLKQFGAVDALRRWFEAPDQLWQLATRRLGHGRQPNLHEAALARSAILLSLSQRVSPLRRTNLARLRISGTSPHIHLPVGPGEGWLTLPANEMKNLRAVKVRIDPGTVEMIRTFRHVFRPVAMAATRALPENKHLFPGACGERKEMGKGRGYPRGLGYTGKEKLCTVFAGHMLANAQLRIDLHVMRHLAAKVILDQDPSAMALVQEVLGHKKIDTTRAYYAEVCGLVAQSRYLELLDRATRKALVHVRFHIGEAEVAKASSPRSTRAKATGSRGQS